MKLKPISLKDLKTLQQICKEAYSKNFGNHWEGNGLELYLEDQFGTDRLKEDLNNPQIGYYFIALEEQAIGFIKVRFVAIFEDFPKETTSELEKIYILPEWKGKGIGKLALQDLMDRICDLGKKTLFLCVIDTNHSAIAFYKKLGFQIHSKTHLEALHFKEELKGMYRMYRSLTS